MLKQIKEICEKYSLRPWRRRGQNFLISQKILEKIIEIADLKKDDLVLEVGPGLGFLTEELAKRAKKVLAIEIDKNLVGILEERLKNYQNTKPRSESYSTTGVEIIKEDILSAETEKIIFNWLKENLKDKTPTPKGRGSDLQSVGGYKIVANLPYNITSRFLRIFLSSKFKPESMVLMIQKEVGERIIAKPPQMSKLSVMVQFYTQPKIVFKVKKENFWPKPKVESAILRLILFEREKIDEDKFFKILRAGFLSPRKYLLNNLEKGGVIKKEEGEKIFNQLGFSPKIRAQELSVEDWLKIYFTI